MEKLTTEQAKELGRQISEGYLAGRLDDAQEDGTCTYIAWQLEVNIWND